MGNPNSSAVTVTLCSLTGMCGGGGGSTTILVLVLVVPVVVLVDFGPHILWPEVNPKRRGDYI